MWLINFVGSKKCLSLQVIEYCFQSLKDFAHFVPEVFLFLLSSVKVSHEDFNLTCIAKDESRNSWQYTENFSWALMKTLGPQENIA